MTPAAPRRALRPAAPTVWPTGFRPDEMSEYEKLPGDAMHGDATLFAREDFVEEAWRIVDPALKAAIPVHDYDPGTWGPQEANGSVSPPGGWQNPAVAG